MIFAIEAKVVELLEGLVQAKALGLFNLMVEGDSAIAISLVAKKKRGSWRLNGWLH